MKKINFIPYVNLKKQWLENKKELLPIITRIIETGLYIGGNEVEKFEKKILKYTGTKYAVALNSGTDALTIGLHLIGVKKNDEVITPPNSFIASTAAIVHLGAKPVFADVLIDQNIDPNEIEKKITSKTKAIMPVHLTGRVSKMDKIMKLANKYKLTVIEDCAQSIGSKYLGQYSGSFGKIGCFSTHPLKNLNSFGDGGFITTNNKTIYEMAKSLSNHGIYNRNIVKNFGYVSRMDNIQAGILNFKIGKLNEIIKKRRDHAKLYINGIKSKNIILPTEHKNEFNTYHTFVIQLEKRDSLKKYLFNKGIETAVHYPIPIHMQPAAKSLRHKKGDFKITERQSKNILSLPIHQNLKKSDIHKIINEINSFVS